MTENKETYTTAKHINLCYEHLAHRSDCRLCRAELLIERLRQQRDELLAALEQEAMAGKRRMANDRTDLAIAGAVVEQFQWQCDYLLAALERQEAHLSAAANDAFQQGHIDMGDTLSSLAHEARTAIDHVKKAG